MTFRIGERPNTEGVNVYAWKDDECQLSPRVGGDRTPAEQAKEYADPESNLGVNVYAWEDEGCQLSSRVGGDRALAEQAKEYADPESNSQGFYTNK